MVTQPAAILKKIQVINSTYAVIIINLILIVAMSVLCSYSSGSSKAITSSRMIQNAVGAKLALIAELFGKQTAEQKSDILISTFSLYLEALQK